MKYVKIKNKKVGFGLPPFLIAEVGINHNGSLKRAFRMIELAKKSGVDAVKFQTFKAEEFISNKKKTYTYFSKGKKIKESMYKMFKRYELSDSSWLKIKNKCEKEKIIFLSTPQNYSDLKTLLKLDISAIKVGSDDFNNIPLIKQYSKFKLPIIISCGMANKKEIIESIKALKYKKNPIILMLCVSEYPTPPENVNLLRIISLKKLFPNLIIGFSDHTKGHIASSIAVSLGACCFEKHFTLNNNDKGPDHWFSENPQSLKVWANSVKMAFKILGNPTLQHTKSEKKMRNLARRSIVASKRIKKGEKIDFRNLCFKRPGNGMPPSQIYKIMGYKAKTSINKDRLITKNLLTNE